MGFRESLIAAFLTRVLGDFVASKNLGLVVGADGMMRLLQDIVRIPEVAFVAWDRLPGGKVPQQAVPDLAPNLAIEVLTASNTAGEMSRKRKEYFEAGVQLVWEVDLDQRIVTVFDSPDSSTSLGEQATLTGGTVLAELRIPVSNIFAELDRKRS